MFAHFEIEGLEHLKEINPPIIVIANHKSYLDPFVLGCAIPWRSRILPLRYLTVKDAYGVSPIIKYILKGFGTVEFDPEHRIGGTRTALRLFKKGQSIGIFPWGTRAKSENEILAFREGTESFGKLDASILPAVIIGTFREGEGVASWFRKAWQFFCRQYHIKVVFGELIYDHIEENYIALHNTITNPK